jgi:NitT/TauT family transport system permease protein
MVDHSSEHQGKAETPPPAPSAAAGSPVAGSAVAGSAVAGSAVASAAPAAVTPSWLRQTVGLRTSPPPAIRRAVGALGIGIVVFAWWLLTLGSTPESRIISPVLLPSPLEVLRSIPQLFTERALLESTAATLKRVLSGFGLSILIGVPLGILAGAYRIFDALTAPLSLFARNIPVAVLIPLTILWFGIDETQKTMFIFISTVPFVFFDAMRAVAEVQDRYVETAQTLGASQRQIITKVLIALALPDIYSSLRNLFGLAFGYIMLAELVNAKHGLGYLLMASQRRGLTEHIFAILILIGLLAYGIDRLLFFFQRGLFPYRRDDE